MPQGPGRRLPALPSATRDGESGSARERFSTFKGGEVGPKVTQTWVHNEADGLIRNPMSGLCLDRAGGQSGGFIKVKGCASKDTAAGDQRWQFGTYHHENDVVKKPKWNSKKKEWDKKKDKSKAKPDIYHE